MLVGKCSLNIKLIGILFVVQYRICSGETFGLLTILLIILTNIFPLCELGEIYGLVFPLCLQLLQDRMSSAARSYVFSCCKTICLQLLQDHVFSCCKTIFLQLLQDHVFSCCKTISSAAVKPYVFSCCKTICLQLMQDHMSSAAASPCLQLLQDHMSG